jgi:hypothetical protein
MSQLPTAGTVAEILDGPLGMGTVVIGGQSYAARAAADEIDVDAFVIVVGEEEGRLLVRAATADETSGIRRLRSGQNLPTATNGKTSAVGELSNLLIVIDGVVRIAEIFR